MCKPCGIFLNLHRMLFANPNPAKDRSEMTMPQHPAWLAFRSRPRRFVAAAVAGICLAAWSGPAPAYRPFDGTDAAVADVGEVEIEFQPGGVRRAGAPKGLSDAVFNYGFADRWEVVLQATPQLMPDGAGPVSVSNAALLKYVLRPGVLQDKPGASIARSSVPCYRRLAGRASDLVEPASCHSGGIGEPFI
jgi:hypothetical protein